MTETPTMPTQKAKAPMLRLFAQILALHFVLLGRAFALTAQGLVNVGLSISRWGR